MYMYVWHKKIYIIIGWFNTSRNILTDVNIIVFNNIIAFLLLYIFNCFMIAFLLYFHRFNILTIFGGHCRRKVKMEVAYMCLYQRITYVVAKKIWKHVWLTYHNWIRVKKSSIFPYFLSSWRTKWRSLTSASLL